MNFSDYKSYFINWEAWNLVKTRKGERADGQRRKANVEISLGIVVEDVSY